MHVEIIFHVDYVCMLRLYHMIVYDIRYMDMIVMISELDVNRYGT